MLLKFSIFDLFFLSFVQLVLSTMLVLSPARGVGTRFRWTGSRITEVLVGGVGAAAIAALACVLTHALWGLPIGGLETAAYLLVIVSVVVIALQPDTNFVGPGLLRLLPLGVPHFHRLRGLHRRRRHALDPGDADGFAGDPPRSGRVRRVDLEHQLRERRVVPGPQVAAAAQGRPRLPALRVAAHPGLQRASRAADRDDQGGRADRLPELRGGRHRQQHRRSGRVGAGGAVLPGPSPRQVRPRRPLARLQGGRLQPGPAPLHRPARARSSAWSTPTTSSSRTTCARPSRTSPTHAWASCRPSRATATSRAATTTPPASTPSRPSTCRSCPRATSATRSRSWARWGCSAAAR